MYRRLGNFHVNIFLCVCVLNFVVGLNCEIILTAKFSKTRCGKLVQVHVCTYVQVVKWFTSTPSRIHALQFTHSTCIYSSPFLPPSGFSLPSSLLPPSLSPPSLLPPPSSLLPQIVHILITLAMEEHDTRRELASVLISDLYSHAINSRDIAHGEYHVAHYQLQKSPPMWPCAL